ncbi:hypothetical protein BLOT_007232 [Blomia tropicalis]|nr:hypothetical protein BLOT_007232 [Blomia tropicalis]
MDGFILDLLFSTIEKGFVVFHFVDTLGIFFLSAIDIGNSIKNIFLVKPLLLLYGMLTQKNESKIANLA